MKVPSLQITESLKSDLAKRVKQLRKKKITPKLVTFLIGDSQEQLSFVSIKKKVGKSIGCDFEFVHLKSIPDFQSFVNLLRTKSQDPKTTGIIIQQPLPSRLYTETLYNFISPLKEIEGHRIKSPFIAPIGLAVMTVLKYIYLQQKISPRLFIDINKDGPHFKKVLKSKRVVLVGTGPTGGMPIARTLSHFKINFLNVNSKTDNPGQYYQEADIIIAAVGKKVITADMLKSGVILINVGLRREGRKLKGDYDEGGIKKVAGYYTTTPGGVGPIDVLYLFKNLIDAAAMQNR